MRERSETGIRPRRTLPATKKNPRDIRQLNSIGEGEYDTDHERRRRIKKKKARRMRLITMARMGPHRFWMKISNANCDKKGVYNWIFRLYTPL